MEIFVLYENSFNPSSFIFCTPYDRHHITKGLKYRTAMVLTDSYGSDSLLEEK